MSHDVTGMSRMSNEGKGRDVGYLLLAGMGHTQS